MKTETSASSVIDTKNRIAFSGNFIIKIAIACIALLLVSSLIFNNSPINNTTTLSPNSIQPGGLYTLVHLLKKQGYQVTANHLVPGTSLSNTLVIVMYQESFDPFVSYSTAYHVRKKSAKKKSAKKKKKDNSINFIDPYSEFLKSHQKNKGSLLTLIEPVSRCILPLKVKPTNAIDIHGKHFNITALPNNYLLFQKFTNGSIPGLVAVNGEYAGKSFVDYTIKNGAKESTINTGEVALNRYIDQQDNAALILNVIHRIYHGKKIFVSLASFSYQRSPTLDDIFGSWVGTAWKQFLLCLTIIGLSLNCRFGFAEKRRAHQRASKELLQGIAQVMKRAKTARAALEEIYYANDKLLRDRIGISRIASTFQRNQRLSPELVKALLSAESAMITSVKPSEAIFIANNLQNSVNGFLEDLSLTRENN